MSNGISDSSATDNTMDATMQTPEKLDKGKGKMAPQDDSMGEGDSEESEEDEEAEGDGDAEVEEPDEDNMEEIDLDNIVNSRTRGKQIDYAQAAKDLPADEEDEEDEDDDDFEEDDMMED